MAIEGDSLSPIWTRSPIRQCPAMPGTGRRHKTFSQGARLPVSSVPLLALSRASPCPAHRRSIVRLSGGPLFALSKYGSLLRVMLGSCDAIAAPFRDSPR